MLRFAFVTSSSTFDFAASFSSVVASGV